MLRYLCLFLFVGACQGAVLSKDRHLLLLDDTAELLNDAELYYFSEYKGGITARWLSGELVLAGGPRVKPPEWFVKGWPKIPLEGQLYWRDASIQQPLTLTPKPEHIPWQKLVFTSYDFSDNRQPYHQRWSRLQLLLSSQNSEYLQLAEQRLEQDSTVVRRWLRQIIARGGLGLRLQRVNAY